MIIEYLPADLVSRKFLRLRAAEKYLIEFGLPEDHENVCMSVTEGDLVSPFVTWWPGQSADAGYGMLYIILNTIEQGFVQFMPPGYNNRPTYDVHAFRCWIPAWALKKPRYLDFEQLAGPLTVAFESMPMKVVFDYLFFDSNKEGHGTLLLQPSLF